MTPAVCCMLHESYISSFDAATFLVVPILLESYQHTFIQTMCSEACPETEKKRHRALKAGAGRKGILHTWSLYINL